MWDTSLIRGVAYRQTVDKKQLSDKSYHRGTETPLMAQLSQPAPLFSPPVIWEYVVARLCGFHWMYVCVCVSVSLRAMMVFVEEMSCHVFRESRVTLWRWRWKNWVRENVCETERALNVTSFMNEIYFFDRKTGRLTQYKKM